MSNYSYFLYGRILLSIDWRDDYLLITVNNNELIEFLFRIENSTNYSSHTSDQVSTF